MQNKRLKVSYGIATPLVRVTDFLMINLCLIGSAWIWLSDQLNVAITVSLLFSLSFLLIGEYTGIYLHRIKKINCTEISRLAATLLLTIAFIEAIYLVFHYLLLRHYLHPFLGPDVMTSLFWYLAPLSGLLLLRLLSFIHMRHTRVRVAILGLTPGGLAVEKALFKEYANMRLDLAFYDDRSAGRFSYLTKSPYRGAVSRLIAEAKAGRIDEVYLALPMVALERIRHFLSLLSDTTANTYIVPDLYSYSTHVSQLRMIGNIQAISIFASPFDGPGALTKRIEDLILGTLIMLLIAPLMLPIALVIRLTSPGPVLFKQARYGLNGQHISVWKFRTMRVQENGDNVMQATKGDPRVTPFGAFLRRTSLDELPQFINVLQGSMSIVGPRPHAVAHNEQYRRLVDNYMIRHKVKPGITGLAQINGYRGETDTLDKMEGRVQYDIDYIQRWSLWLDLKIIFLTLFNGFRHENAY
ncbi:undecaprenyl-phosphate glucose phosphotransferase [Edwardsiella piscicida]|uniref:undecaprenyl-phosphate glucose phosphotransferase n=1 Tax=Edwardsiella piscicida TaxID=1263550 RepID=UPI0002C06D73|nr:undecaprenyl-phosphate glucose phosphotransferase [Edwardsiella piscicida]AGH73901.1 putative capsular polysaccharide biosynthesis protein [Edwardsiella piscicida C07-087]EKS7780277.1 undecaprenyl-phosphate glucose phosphotransferase [Edwardsiella piscicida]EKS7783318.1 undecaprenyl-phosphate glucose phosphotransferase [Edwardsiella piscicida]UCQ22941.1 undecaprenyl-phosphate glucose phosphotransferase [Edwardsiella piscicida]UCQ33145.1 undecaprenyl-phosphate glucose phosphotransferase [Edw